jgi:hypothetical protein
VGEARALHKLVHAQGRLGFEGHVQGEHALAKLAHGYVEGQDPYGPGSFPKPYLPGEGSAGGQGSLTQADVTPGAEPTRKPEGGA